ncbi:MAG: S-layer homology domain-containing protein [Deltaproteobacteria bacterium]
MVRRQKIAVMMFLLMAFVFSIGGELLAAEKFSDVTAGDPNGPYINFVASKGIITGFPDGTYHPRDGLTRAQAAVIICKAAGLKTPAIENTNFKDVPAGYWAISYIDAASKAGYLKGFSDGTYKPDNKFTRAQAVSLIMRICTQKERAALPPLQDMNSQHWAAPEMATALSLDMIQLSSDGKQIYPDADMTRSDLARALAILLTKDPVLSQVKLTGKLTEIKGEVTLIRNNKTQRLTKDIEIFETDVIKTGSDGRARLVFPDGSGNLLEANCEIVIKKADGKSYIKQNGTPGVAVDFLNIELKKGTLFAALSTKTENKADTAKTSLSSRLASRDPLRQLAAAAQPWYKTAQEKKVRMKVDMPWGVAAVRGTFIKVSVNQDGTCEVCCLSGTADTSSSAGNVAVNGGDKAVIQSEDSAPQTGDMSAADKADMENEEAWIVNTALQMDASRAVEVLVEVNAETSVQTVIDALKDAGIDLKPEVIEQLKQDLEDLDEKTPDIDLKDADSKDGGKTPGPDPGGGDGGISYVAYDKAGTYGGASAAAPVTINGTAIINAAGVTLQNMIINGNLTLAASIGEDEVTLQNVKVQGTTTINGGGACSVHVIDCQLYTVIVDKENNSVRIVAKGTTTIGPLTLNSGAILQEDSGLTGTGFSEVLTGLIDSGAQITFSGNFTSISISSPKINIAVESGSIGQINLASSAIGTSLNLADGVSISSLAVNATGVTVGGSGAITSWNVAQGITAVIGGSPVSGSGSCGISYGEITSLLDAAALTELTCIEGTADGRGKTILGGGVFIYNDTLEKWVMPRYSRADGTINGKTYVDTRSDDCLIPFADAADYSIWTTDDLSGLNLPNGHDYIIYLRMVLEGDVIKDDQDRVAIYFEHHPDVSIENSTWLAGNYDDGMAEIEVMVADSLGNPVSGLSADQFVFQVAEGASPPQTISAAQLPFGAFYFNDRDGFYGISYIGDGEYTFSGLKVGGVPINIDESCSETITISGGSILNGTICDTGGQPMAGVRVSAAFTDAPVIMVINYTTTDNDGFYSLRVPTGYPLTIVFEKTGFYTDPSVWGSEAVGTYTQDATMVEDNFPPIDIAVDRGDESFTELLLMVTGGPLSDESWNDIFEMIKSNTWIEEAGMEETPWIDADPECLWYTISLDGRSMVLTYTYEGLAAAINDDFVIPAYLVVDRAGNQAENDIVIRTHTYWTYLGEGQLGQAFSGGISVLMPYTAYCDANGAAHIKSFAMGEGESSWNDVTAPTPDIQPLEWTDCQDIKVLAGINMHAALLGSDGGLRMMKFQGGSWSDLGTPVEGGATVNLFDATIGSDEGGDHPILAYQETLFDEVYGTSYYGSVMSYVYGGEGGYWSTLADGFYEGDQSLQALNLEIGGFDKLYLSFVDNSGSLFLKRYGDGLQDIVAGQPISFDPDYGLSMLASADDVLVAYVDAAKNITVMDYCYNDSSGEWEGNGISPGLTAGASPVQLLSWCNGYPALLYTSGPLNKATISSYENGAWVAPENLILNGIPVNMKQFSTPVAAGKCTMAIEGITAIEGSSSPYLLIKGQDGFLHAMSLMLP